MKNTLSIAVFLILSSCTMKPQNDKEFQELHKHKGTENYEIVEVFDNKFEIKKDILVDTQSKNIVVKAYKKQPLKERGLYPIKRVSNLGENIDVIDNSYRTLKDGTIRSSRYYINWVIDGDTTKHKYIDPFTNKEIQDPYKFIAKETDPEKWLAKFKELYAKAQYIYIYILLF